jgi:hypothetical protein
MTRLQNKLERLFLASIFSIVYYFKLKLGAFPTNCAPPEQALTLTLLANIRLPRANTLAYFAITTKKFYDLDTWTF